MPGDKEKKLLKGCVHCGNNPVPHFLNWYNESLGILLTPVRIWLLDNTLTRWFGRHCWGQKFGLFTVAALGKLGIVTLRKNKELCKVTRAKVLWDEAEKRGIEMGELLFFGRPFDTYVAEKKIEIRKQELETRKGQKIIFSGLPRPTSSQNSALEMMDDKWYLKKLFIGQNLPVPAGAAATSFRQALKIFRSISKPVIVKPRTGSRGRHSTTFVRTESNLKQAFKIAKKLCHWVMVEEQLFGPVYRATVIDFKLCGVLRGDPPQVMGDGKQTVEQLINAKNSLPHPGVKDVVISEEMKMFVGRELGGKFNNLRYPSFGVILRPSASEAEESPTKEDILRRSAPQDDVDVESDKSLNYIPNVGEIINLSEKIGVNYGGSSSEDLSICHPDNKELFVRAARVVGDPIVGFDFIIQDITKSYREQKCGFIEANSLPFINLHHDPLLGKPENVAAAVWNMVKM